MNTINDWAAQWGVSAEALADLRTRMTSSVVPTDSKDRASSEGEIVNKIRLNAARSGILLFRNNVGAGKLENGSFVRWGLCNDSSALNAKSKSSDLIGIRPVRITPAHVGHTLGVFIAREVKTLGWKYHGTERERAQLHFIEVISSLGGDARFSSSPEGDL